MNWHYENAGNIVHAGWSLLLGKVTHEMAAELVIFSHDVEEEWFHVVVKGFGAKEELGQETEVLAVDRVLTAVDLEE
jgi:hypothetical protein